jgi:hypothetical protein
VLSAARDEERKSCRMRFVFIFMFKKYKKGGELNVVQLK